MPRACAHSPSQRLRRPQTNNLRFAGAVYRYHQIHKVSGGPLWKSNLRNGGVAALPSLLPLSRLWPSYALVITGYDGPRKARSRNRRHTLEENALGYNEHTIRRITHGAKPARRALPPLSNVKASSAKGSALARSVNVTSSGQLLNTAPIVEISVPKVVEVAGQRERY